MYSSRCRAGRLVPLLDLWRLQVRVDPYPPSSRSRAGIRRIDCVRAKSMGIWKAARDNWAPIGFDTVGQITRDCEVALRPCFPPQHIRCGENCRSVIHAESRADRGLPLPKGPG